MRTPSVDRAAERLRRLLACLGDPSRFELARALLGGERCVTDLARTVGLSQSCTTRHLQTLAREGLVRSRRDGKRVLCRLRPEGATAELLALVGRDVGGGPGLAPDRATRTNGRRHRRLTPGTAGPAPQVLIEPTHASAPAHDFGVDARDLAATHTDEDRLPDPEPSAGPQARGEIEDFLL